MKRSPGQKKSSDGGGANGNQQNIKGTSVSRGIAVGKVVNLYGGKRQFYRLALKPGQIERELRRFRAAVRLATRQLKRYATSQINSTSESATAIFEAQSLILNDTSFLTKIENTIVNERVNAEWALMTVSDSYVATFRNLPDTHLSSKYIDLKDVSERLQAALGGASRTGIRLAKNSIIVAKEIKPSTLIELEDAAPSALITEHGGWTSHTFILAREMNLPAVTGIKNVLRRLKSGDNAIVDGFAGNVIVNPNSEAVAEYNDKAEIRRQRPEQEPVARGPLHTLDGTEITLRANVDIPGAYSAARRFGARGIGLYRSEFLFNQFRGYPSESEQISTYRNIGDLVGDDGVRIRTFDLTVEQLTEQRFDREKNPALGLRAIRLSLADPKNFRIQLRSILIAGLGRKIDVVLPMISDVSEIVQTRRLLRKESDYLKKKGIEFGELRLGAMIETPAAVLIANEIAEVSDFICLGTNDLVQYTLAVDRDNEAVADLFSTLHPAVIRSIALVLQAAQKQNIACVVCGEMAGSPYYAPVLIGLGATELSMNVNSIRRVRAVLAGIAFEEAAELAKAITESKTAADAENLLFECFRTKWHHLRPA